MKAQTVAERKSMTGPEFRAIRLRLGLTLQQWARALGYSPGRAAIMASELESEAKTITPSVARLAEMYRRHGVPREWLETQ